MQSWNHIPVDLRSDILRRIVANSQRVSQPVTDFETGNSASSALQFSFEGIGALFRS